MWNIAADAYHQDNLPRPECHAPVRLSKRARFPPQAYSDNICSMNSPQQCQIPELIAPAGDWDCVRAAVENGADAIYFGLDRHNARMRAANFTLAELPELMAFLHLRGLRGYVTFNTLIFADEIEDAGTWLRAMIESGADAAIVQDIGVCRLIRCISPDFPIHASTQMTITSAAGVRLAKELGCSLVVLARECSVRDIERIRDSFPESDSCLPLEIFVHGALCVAYSGQCLTSESLGGRSANRGVCAQACRMPYDLVADGESVPLGDRRYLLSPRDLAALDLLPDLARAGAASLKIEGRLKSPEYVANITGIYRRALDQLAAESGCRMPFAPSLRSAQQAASSVPMENATAGKETLYQMEMAFSRGLYTGWLGGTNNQELVHGRFGKKRGVFLGEVRKVLDDAVLVDLQAPLKPGDGICFDAGRPDEDEQGGRVYGLRPQVRLTRVEFGRGDIDFHSVHEGDKIWKTDDPELNRHLRQTFSGDQPRFRRPVTMEVCGEAGDPLKLEVRLKGHSTIKVESHIPLVVAEKQPLTPEKLREQFGRLGGTPFYLGDLTCNLAGPCILPLSELNRMRREAMELLSTQVSRPPGWKLYDPRPFHELLPPVSFDRPPAREAELIVLVRSLDQLEAALKVNVRTVYCELEDPKKYREAVALFRSFKSEAHEDRADEANLPGLWIAPPRVFKPGEDWIHKIMRAAGADGILVRNYDNLEHFQDLPCIGDYSLNVANAFSADFLLRRFGLKRLTASYDLNVDQLEGLLRTSNPSFFELTIHQHMPMFHMEHCIFCAFLSDGTDYTNCGRPCDTRQVKLRDRAGAEHPVKADVGCRNTVFNALAQTGAESILHFADLGIRHFRIEFLEEKPETVSETIGRYRQLLRREIEGNRLWRDLKLINQIGVTRGTLQN